MTQITENQVPDVNEKPDLSPESLHTNTQVKPVVDVPSSDTLNNLSWLLIILIFIFICAAILIGLFLNIKGQSDVKVSGLFYKNKAKRKDTNIKKQNTGKTVDTSIKTQLKNDSGEEVSEQSAESNNKKNMQNEGTSDNINENFVFKLETPVSVDKCIKNFLEITKEK